MHLDIVTLLAAGSFVAALSGFLLAGAWIYIRVAPALLWWAAANYVFAIGIGFLTYGTAAGAVWALAAGGMLASVSPALVWAGTRTFVHRPVWVPLLIASTVAWLAVGAASSGDGAHKLLNIVGFVIWIAYLLASNWELWRARAEPLTSRWPLMAMFSLHALIFCGGIYDFMSQKMEANTVPPLDSWFGLIHFETLVYVIATALLMVVMCKERSELGYIKAARIDALTGIANRGAFFAGAERLLDRCRASDSPLSVIVFDLDRFKSINDTHGHAVGDRVLRMFVDSARDVLRPNDFFGRYGGEEFAVVLPGATVETAYVIADRVRYAFAESCREVDGMQLYATVSAGVAAASLSAGFNAVLKAADRAMYRAKNRGRNRVERADDHRADEAATVVRLA
jgi:diguanylate cyclase (GGDEF)-like protein